ncbi:trimeric intracellular cation channel family protein [Aeromicrobium flavum]|uniref:trimeric intracellular cation channel family protein n=1 Tax=Aeromicrobium flavum TaxID=416568 RepID=UPI0031D66914
MNEDLFAAAEVIGIIAFAVSGGYAAVRAGMDWLGVVVLAVVVAVGGGTLRDLLLGIEPVWWVRDPDMLVVATVTAVVVLVVATLHPQSKLDSWRVVLYADAIGLATFTVTGTSIALEQDVRPWIAIIFGVITGTGGGVIRDVLVRRKPLVLVGEIYALAAIAGGVLYVVLRETELASGLAAAAGAALILVVRAAAMRWHWRLPRFSEPGH